MQNLMFPKKGKEVFCDMFFSLILESTGKMI